MAAYAIDPSKALYDPHGVPVDVIIDQVVAVLQVLPFRYAICGNQDVEIRRTAGEQHRSSFGDWGKTRQHGVHVGTQLGNGASAVHRAGDLCRFQTELLFCKFTYVCIKIIRRVGERGENDYLGVAGIYRMCNLVFDQSEKSAEFCVMLGSDVGDHARQQFKRFGVLFKLPFPRHVVHVGKIDPDFLSYREVVRVLIVIVEIFAVGDLRQVQNTAAGTVIVDRFNRAVDKRLDSVNGEPKRIYRAFQPFEKVDAHQPPYSLFSSLLRKRIAFIVRERGVLCQP